MEKSPFKHGVAIAIALMTLSGLGMSGCTSRFASDEKNNLKVVTTTLPITNFTKAVAGNRAEVTYLLPTNVGPHEYQAKPEDVAAIASSNVLVENGLGLEEYLEELVTNANNKNLKKIDTSEGIETISERATEGHEHSAEERGKYNPHIWLDPKRAIEQVENIRDGLIAADPEGKEIYTANAAEYIDKLEALDAEIEKALKPYAGQEFVTYHDFAAYFAERYALKAEYLVGIPEENPSPEDITRVIYAVKNTGLEILLTEPQAGGNPFEALAKDLEVKVSYFDPMETSGASGIDPDYYFIGMRQNLKNLEAAFGKQSVRIQKDLRWWYWWQDTNEVSQKKPILARGTQRWRQY